MTRFGMDAAAFVELARSGADPGEHQLVGPASLRSSAMSLVYREVRSGALTAAEAKTILERITTLKARLLGDRVSRATAWRLATELDLEDTPLAEYLAVTRLQADALIALDPGIRDLAAGVVPLATLDDLTG